MAFGGKTLEALQCSQVLDGRLPPPDQQDYRMPDVVHYSHKDGDVGDRPLEALVENLGKMDLRAQRWVRGDQGSKLVEGDTP